MTYQPAQHGRASEPQPTPEQPPAHLTHSLTEQERAHLIDEAGNSGGRGEGDSSATKAAQPSAPQAACEHEPLPCEEESKDQESG